MATFAEKLKSLRELKGLSQAALAQSSKVPLGTLRNHEQNNRAINSEDLFAYCQALAVQCSEFAGCTGKRAESESSPFDEALAQYSSAKDATAQAMALADALRAAEEGAMPSGKFAKLVKNYRHATGQAKKLAREKLMSAIAKEAST